MTRSKRRSSEEILKILAQLEVSGQPVREFAKKHRLAVSTLDLWRRKYRGRQRASSPLRRVSVVGSEAPPADCFEVRAPSGLTLRIPPTADLKSSEAVLTMFICACSR